MNSTQTSETKLTAFYFIQLFLHHCEAHGRWVNLLEERLHSSYYNDYSTSITDDRRHMRVVSLCYPVKQVVDENIKKHWPQDNSLQTPSYNSFPVGKRVPNLDSVLSPRQVIFEEHKTLSPTPQALSFAKSRS